MCSNPAVAATQPLESKRVTPRNFQDMVADLNNPDCKPKYVCTPGLSTTGWNCYNQNVRIALFNIHHPAAIARAEGRIRRFNNPSR